MVGLQRKVREEAGRQHVLWRGRGDRKEVARVRSTVQYIELDLVVMLVFIGSCGT
jgi:hypothetical protein